MRILLVTHYYPSHRGGIEIVAGQLSSRWAAAGMRVRWAASGVTPADGPGAVPMRTWNITERRLGFPYPLWSPGSLLQMRGLVDECDIVHLHDSLYMGNALASRFARHAGKPVVVTQHIGEVPYRNPVLRTLLKTANRTIGRRVLGTCEQAVFISPRVRDYFTRFVRFRRPPAYIANGVDLRVFHPVHDVEQNKRPALLFVGRFVEKKGLPLIRDIARLRPDWDVRLAGWGSLDPATWKLPNVACLGPLMATSLAAEYRSADLLLLPSVGEGFPLVIQEAAACGLPSLVSSATRVGHEETAGFVSTAEPGVEPLLAELDRLLSDREDLRLRGRLAAAHAASHWNWDVIADEYLNLFKEALS